MMDKRKVATEQATTTEKDTAKIQKSADTAKILQKKNYVQMIGEELAKMDNDVSGNYGIFIVETANQAMSEARKQPDPKPLWLNLWYENEIHVLWAKKGFGKSTLAVQIATDIAKERNVLYFDFELTNKQFQKRYTNDQTGVSYTFPDRFFRPRINPDMIDDVNMVDGFLHEIESVAVATDTKIIVIDNITFICADSEKSDVAGRLMMQLYRLKMKHGLSILVLAHTHKFVNDYAPINDSDMAGSQKILNFVDSESAIGKSIWGEDYRYIKQMKTRVGKIEHGEWNVISMIIEKPDCFTRFRCIGYCKETEHCRATKSRQIQTDEKMESAKKALKKILSKDGLCHNDLVRRLSRELGVCEKTSKERIKDLKDDFLFVANGKYHIKS